MGVRARSAGRHRWFRRTRARWTTLRRRRLPAYAVQEGARARRGDLGDLSGPAGAPVTDFGRSTAPERGGTPLVAAISVTWGARARSADRHRWIGRVRAQRTTVVGERRRGGPPG